MPFDRHPSAGSGVRFVIPPLRNVAAGRQLSVKISVTVEMNRTPNERLVLRSHTPRAYGPRASSLESPKETTCREIATKPDDYRRHGPPRNRPLGSPGRCVAHRRGSKV